MTLRHAALSSLLILVTTACSDPSGGNGRGGAGGSGQSGGSGGNGGSGGAGTGGSGTGGSNTGGSGTGGSTGGSGGATGGSSGTGGATGGAGGATGGAGGATGGAGGATGGAGGATGGSAGASGGSGGTTGTGGTAGASGGTGGAAGTGTGGSGGVVDAGSKDGNAGTGGSSGAAGKDAGSGGGTVDAAPPPPVDGGPAIPPPNGTCPDFVTGDVNFTPTAGGTRKVALTMGDMAKTGGPLIVYWYATNSNPTEATKRGLPAATVAAAGGVIAAPYDVAGAGTFPWLDQQTQHDALFDEILSCAVQKTKISPARVHSLGFSAGALMTTHLSFARSKYLASVATYSGGQQGTATFQEPNNKFPAMIMTGGMGNDMVVIDFYTASQTWQTTLKGAGHFAMFCDHGGGHNIPSAGVVGGVFQFFMDHPYGTNPSPYAGGKIPSAISICKE